MAYLAKGNKPDLLSVCEEMGVEVDQSSKMVDIKKLILNSESYVEEEVKIILDRVISDRKERERSKQEENEREERSKEEKEREERSKEEKEREERSKREEREERSKQEEREEREKEREERMAREARQHELELRKLELSQQNQPLIDESGRRVEIGPKIQSTQITTKFDEKHDEISLYLINFERKAELAQVLKKEWVAYLLVVLPAELSNMLAREPTERANNYDFVKDLILKWYRLNSEKLKRCFYRHQKSAEKSWRNYAHELNTEVREHFLDDWIKLKTPYELAEKLDEYESIKQSFRREIPKKNSYKFQGGVNYSGARPKETPKDFKSNFQIKKEPIHEKNHEKDFEKRRQLRCYECGSYSHVTPQCDKLKKNYETVASNETVWIRTPLEETPVCLPMAEVELDCVFGHVITKAAVLRDSLDQGKYLLGNKTAALFEEVKKNKEIQVYMW
ncbi:SCAN box domain-containing protein [Trichonephila clavipes]|nr:SCAN box domain-containing protein [Trichonephila clavipes]